MSVEHWSLAPLIPVVGEYGAARLVSTLLITVRNKITKAASFFNLKGTIFGSKLLRFWQKEMLTMIEDLQDQ